MKNIREFVLEAQTDDSKWSLWEDSLKQNGLSLTDTLIKENMVYLNWSREKVLDCWGEKGTEKIKEKWLKQNPQTESEIINYYNTLDLYIPELSSWHTIIKNEDLLKIVEFLQFSVKKNLKTFLDFGAGIGPNGLLFNKYGFTVTLADVSDSMINYSKWRLKQHNVRFNSIDLKVKTLPDNVFDCATAIEVLEHMTDPTSAMEKIRRSLKIGGYIFCTTPFYSDPNRPQHIVHDAQTAQNFEKLGFELISESNKGLYRTLKRIR